MEEIAGIVRIQTSLSVHHISTVFNDWMLPIGATVKINLMSKRKGFTRVVKSSCLAGI